MDSVFVYRALYIVENPFIPLYPLTSMCILTFGTGSQQKWYRFIGGMFMAALVSDTQECYICNYSDDPAIFESIFK